MPAGAMERCSEAERSEGSEGGGAWVERGWRKALMPAPVPAPAAAGMSEEVLLAHAQRLAEEDVDVKGVNLKWQKYKANKKWQVYINAFGKQEHLGYFSCRAEAIACRLRAEVDVAAGRQPRKKVPAPVPAPAAAGMSEEVLLAHAQRLAEEDVDVKGVKATRENLKRKEKKWQVYITASGSSEYLGFFSCRAEAIACRLRAEVDVAAGRQPRKKVPAPVPVPVAAGMSEEELRAHAQRLAEEDVHVKGVNGNSNKWKVAIYPSGKQVYLGAFSCRAVAIACRLRAEVDVAAGRQPRKKVQQRARVAPAPAPAPVPVPVAAGMSEEELLEHAQRLAEEDVDVKGVNLKRNEKKWNAQIYAFGKQEHLGYFSCRAEAIACRLRAEVDVAAGRQPRKKVQQRARAAPARAAPAPAPVPVPVPVAAGMSDEELRAHARCLANEGADVVGVHVHRHQPGKYVYWAAQVRFQGQKLHLCTSKDRAKAIEARLRAELAVAAGRHPKPLANAPAGGASGARGMAPQAAPAKKRKRAAAEGAAGKLARVTTRLDRPSKPPLPPPQRLQQPPALHTPATPQPRAAQVVDMSPIALVRRDADALRVQLDSSAREARALRLRLAAAERDGALLRRRLASSDGDDGECARSRPYRWGQLGRRAAWQQ